MRRDFLAASGAAATAWLGVEPATLVGALRAARAAVGGAAVAYEVLTDEQAADVDAIAAQIIPSDGDVPGAREARVVVFIDRLLAGFAAGQRQSMLEGLDDLNRKAAEQWPGAGRFATLSGGRQCELIREIEATPFFAQARFAVLAGMFAHPSWGGNYEGAGWRLLDFDPRAVWSPPCGAYDAAVNR